MIDYFDYALALNETTGNVVPNAVAQVFAMEDTTFATPLQVTDLTDLPMSELVASPTGIYPPFKVVGEYTQVMVRSGDVTTPITSVYGMIIGAGLDPETVSEAIASGQAAENAQAAAEIARAGAETARDQAVAAADGLSVTTFGAVGDGTTNDSAAFQAALNEAGGARVAVPKGRYSITNIQLPAKANLVMDPEAVLVHRSGGALPMFEYTTTTTHLKIRGGQVDGQRETIAGWPSVIRGQLPFGSSIDIEDVHFTKTVFAVIRLTNFGGYLNFSRNKVTDQAQHSGVAGQFTTVITIVNGQEGAKGTIITDGNWHHFDAPVDHEGSNPGGYFIATSPDVGGGATPFGNQSTWQAIGNYFHGYGQFGGPGTGTNDISPLHTYPTIRGARWTNNYFENCGFCAMSAKSVMDFVCSGNTIVNGIRSSRNHASEGAISYVPGYQAGSEVRPRAVIANNSISDPGGEATMGQTGIAVKGTSTSKATDVVVIGNTYNGDGVGVDLVNVENAVISSNILRIVAGVSPADAGIGVRFSNVEGQVLVTGNSIECDNGNCITGLTGNTTADVTITGNELIDSRTNGACVLFRDCATLTITANVMKKPSGQAMNLGGTIGQFFYDESNNLIATTAGTLLTVAIAWANIIKAAGAIVGAGTPVGKVIPAYPGVTYRQTDAAGSATLFLAVGTTAADWAVIQTASSGSVPQVNTASIVYGTNSVGASLNRRAVGGERVAGQLPVYGSGGDIVVANAPATSVSATSKTYVDAAVAAGGDPNAFVARVTDESIVYGTNSAGVPVNRRAVGGERVPGQLPVYGTGGDVVVANEPVTAASAASKSWVEAQIAAAIAAL